MKKFNNSVFLLLTIFLFSSSALAQESNLQIYGDVRIAHIGFDTDADGIGGPNSLLRLRPGVKYLFNENHSFSGRLVYLVSKELEPLKFTIKADGNRALAYGSVSFDEFYYQFKNSDFQVKFGRFQHSVNVLSNAKRSHLKFQSNANFVHWTDGLYIKKSVTDDWYGEMVLEYQNRGNLTHPYSIPLNFQNNEHNVIGYFGVENRTRDEKNIIQKGFGLFIAPDAYFKPDGYTTYIVLDSRIAIDIPKKELLKGGSFRIVGELGQNLNTSFSDGTSAVASFGINNFAEKHEFMVELAMNDSQWLTGTAYARNTDDIEFRYKYIFSDKLNFDMRYRIRDSRNDFNPIFYSTFFRLTYSF
tara:strand:- start:172772 stop:173845 length:1074 start_codon:yes stop_codon:yes gene_type:complete